MTAVSTRLVRLLNMVPYFQANPRITYAEAASDLGVSVKQLRDDLNQLWMCGLPGYGPGDLIDFEFSGDTIEVKFTAGIDHPLRLTSPEATGVLVALRALVDVPGVVDPEAARSAIAKIESAAGTLSHGAVAAVDEPAPVESEAAAAVRVAVRDGRALAIEYYSASHDMLSSRVVDPIRVVLVADHSYLEAWCRSAESVRLFRFDRIVDAKVSDEPSAPPRPAVDAGPDTSLFDADPSLPSAKLLIDRSASWMFDYYPLRVIRELPDGAVRAGLRLGGARARTGGAGPAGARIGRRGAQRLQGRCRRRRKVDSAKTEGDDQIGRSTTLALGNRHRRVRAALRRQEAPGRGALAGPVDADLQVRGQGDEVRLQAGSRGAARHSDCLGTRRSFGPGHSIRCRRRGGSYHRAAVGQTPSLITSNRGPRRDAASLGSVL
jgi:proteasome accessory factor C